MNLFANIIRDIRESKEGRIRRVSGHWMLTPAETREDGSYGIPGVDRKASYLDRFERISTDQEGRKMRLIGKQAVHCPNREYVDQFASIKQGETILSVPIGFCKKCPHYRTARQSRRKYATCGYKRSDQPATDTLVEFTGLLNKARRIPG